MNKKLFVVFVLFILFVSCRKKENDVLKNHTNGLCMSRDSFLLMYTDVFNEDISNKDDFAIAYISSIHAKDLNLKEKGEYMSYCLAKYKNYFNQ